MRAIETHDVTLNAFRARLDPEVAQAVDAAAKIFEVLGAHVELADPGIGDTTPIFNTHWLAGVANALGGLPDDKLDLLDPGLNDFTRKGRSISLMDYFSVGNLTGGSIRNLSLSMRMAWPKATRLFCAVR